MGLSPEERERFLRALEEDWVFRYAVLGLLGMQELRDRFDRLVELVDRINRTLERIEGKLSRITAPLEEETNDVVTYYLRQRGINIETGTIRLDQGYEFDIYGSNGQLTIVGAARERVDPAFIVNVIGRVRETVKSFPSKFPGRIVIVIYSVRADPEAIEEARRQGVWLFESMREKTPFPA